jgi:hypothetical protein
VNVEKSSLHKWPGQPEDLEIRRPGFALPLLVIGVDEQIQRGYVRTHIILSVYPATESLSWLRYRADLEHRYIV